MANRISSDSEAGARRAQDEIVQIVTVVEELLAKAKKLADEHQLPFDYTLERGEDKAAERDWDDSGCYDRDEWESSGC